MRSILPYSDSRATSISPSQFVPCTGRWILSHCSTRGVPSQFCNWSVYFVNTWCIYWCCWIWVYCYTISFFWFPLFFFFFPLFFFSSFLMEEMTVKFFLFLFLTHTLYFFFLSVGYIHLAFHSPVTFNVALLHIKYRNLATVYIHIPIVFYVLVINLPGLYKLKTNIFLLF